MPSIIALASALLWFWLHRGGPSIKHLGKVTISGFDRIAEKELHDGAPGSGNYPAPAEAYFIGPSGDISVKAPDFSVKKADPPADNPATKMILLYRGDASEDCQLYVSRLYRSAQLPNWAKLSAKQRSAFESGSEQVLEVGVDCGG